MALETKEITIRTISPTYSDIVSTGPFVTPQKLIRLYSDTEWEEFIEECTFSLKDGYKDVRRAGGAGDQGVDIAAFRTDQGFQGEWDNFQCKHYDHSLYPSDAYLELGKLCYYTFIGEYTVPQNYHFVAPQGVGTSLSKLLRIKNDDLRDSLIANWENYCESKITAKQKILLEGALKSYVEAFDFSIVKDVSVLELLEIHRKTPYFHSRFGGGLPKRPISDSPPQEIAITEVIYIQKLLNAYAEFLNLDQCSLAQVDAHNALKKHLRDARIHFYSAESLHKFSRDYLEAGEFERLQETILLGIENIILSQHGNGFERVRSAIQEVYKIQIDSHPLKHRLELADRSGICHQLANGDRLAWANRDQ